VAQRANAAPRDRLFRRANSVRSKGAEISPTAGVDTDVTVTCPEGSIPWGGGYQANVPVYLMSELPESLGWHVRVRSTGATLEGGLPGSLYVYTECVKTSP
jgi:hypothetical protein